MSAFVSVSSKPKLQSLESMARYADQFLAPEEAFSKVIFGLLGSFYICLGMFGLIVTLVTLEMKKNNKYVI